MGTVTVTNTRKNVEHQYFISGPYLKRKESGDDEAYEIIRKRWTTPLASIFGIAATAAGAYLPHLIFAGAITVYGPVEANPFHFAFHTLVESFRNITSGSPFPFIGAGVSTVAAGVFGIGSVGTVIDMVEEYALEKANFEYRGINLDIATDQEIAEFIGNDDSQVINGLKNLERGGDYDVSFENPLHERTRRPQSKAPRYDYGGGGGDDDGGGD